MTPQEPRQAAIERMAEAMATDDDPEFPGPKSWYLEIAAYGLDALLSDPQSVIDLLVAKKVLEVVHQFTCSLSLDCGDCDCSTLYRVTPESEAKE